MAKPTLGKIVLSLVLVLTPVCGWTADVPVLAILPFDVHGPEDTSELGRDIRKQFQERLAQEGIDLLDFDLTDRVLAFLNLGRMGVESARKAAEFLEADYGLFGSLSVVGSALSLDVTMISTDPARTPARLYAQGRTLEEVPEYVRRMSDELILYVFGDRRVIELDVAGNERIEKDAILAVVKTEEGTLFSLETTREDIKAIYQMGYFEDVRVQKEQLAEGIRITYEVKENPTIEKVQFEGLHKIKEKDAEDAFNVKAYTILNERKLSEGVGNLEELYRKDGYLRAEINYRIEPMDERRVVVVVDVDEGKKIYIRKIAFVGNEAFDNGDLKDEMDTSEKGLLFWLLKSGKLEMPKLENDLENLSSFYQNHGYLRVKVGRPDIRTEDDGIYITIPIDEGPKYHFGTVQVEGEFIEPRENILEKLKTKEGEVFNRETVQKDILALREMYTNKGYAFPDIQPEQRVDDENLLIYLTFNLKKNHKYHFERINIVGNVKTRDKVVRRELAVYEQGLFNSAGLRRSSQNLHRLDFFETVELNTSRGSEEDTLNLDVEVTEKKTGSMAVGAGFSSSEGVIGSFEIQERNFMGYGQRLAFSAQIGGRSNQFRIYFTEPWLFDIPLSTTFDIYKLEREYDDFTRDSWGGGIHASYPIWKRFDLRLWMGYRFEAADVTDVDEDASVVIRDQEGRHTTSAVSVGFRRDTRDRVFLTTRGSDNWVSAEFAGSFLGGSAGFVKYMANTGWYFPVKWGTSLFLRGQIGYIQQIEGQELLLYEKFYLGGINTLRGFQSRNVSPKDPVTGDRIGGDKYLLGNVEFRFPLIKEASIYGVAFFDVGNVYPDDEAYDLSNLRRSVGAGIRWYSPLGPLRLEWGYNLSPEADEDRSVWDFTIGYGF